MTAGRYRGSPARPGGETDCGGDLRAHGSGCEVVTGQLLGRDPRQPALPGSGPVHVDRVDVGGHDQDLGVEILGQQAAREILVDHGLHADQAMRVVF